MSTTPLSATLSPQICVMRTCQAVLLSHLFRPCPEIQFKSTTQYKCRRFSRHLTILNSPLHRVLTKPLGPSIYHQLISHKKSPSKIVKMASSTAAQPIEEVNENQPRCHREIPLPVRFYDHRTFAPDSRSRTLPEILSWPDDRLESEHDYIQALFPLPEPSPFNPNAPVVDGDTAFTFRSDPALRANVMKALNRMLTFYGLTAVISPQPKEPLRTRQLPTRDMSLGAAAALASTGGRVYQRVRMPLYAIHPDPVLWPQRGHLWWRNMTHNHLRITRILRSLRVLGCQAASEALYRCLEELVKREKRQVSYQTRLYWWRAARRRVRLPPDDREQNPSTKQWLDTMRGKGDAGTDLQKDFVIVWDDKLGVAEWENSNWREGRVHMYGPPKRDVKRGPAGREETGYSGLT